MRKLIKKMKKNYIIFNVVLMTSFLLVSYTLIKNNIERVIKVSLKQALNYNIDFENIKFINLNTIEVDNFQLKDADNKEIVIESPYLTINLNFRNVFEGYVIENITMNGGLANIQIYDMKRVNILNALGLKIEVFSPDKMKVKGLKQILARDMTVNFSDISFETPITKEIKQVNGGINFIDGINLSFKGYSGEKNEEYVNYSFSTEASPPRSKLKLQNFTIDSAMSQYSRANNFFETTNGKADLEFEFNKDLELYGGGKITDIKGIDKINGFEVNNGTAEILFQKKYIRLDSTVDFSDSKIEASLTKVGKEVSIDIKGKNINIDDVSNSKLSKEFNTPQLAGVISYFNLTLNTQAKKPRTIKGKGYIRSKNISINEINEINDLRGEFSFNEKIIAFNNLRFNARINELEDFPINANFTLSGNSEKLNSSVQYELKNIDSFAEFDDLKGTINYDFENGTIELTNSTDKLSGYIKYAQNESLDLDFDIDNYSLNYNFAEKYNLYGKISLNYNILDNELRKTNVNLTVKNSYYFDDFELVAKDRKGGLDIKKLSITSNSSFATFSGNINLKELSYDIVLNDSYIDSKDLFYLKDVEKLGFQGKVLSRIKGDNINLDADFTLDSEFGKYNLNYNSLKTKGKIKLNLNNPLNSLEFESKSSLKLFEYDQIYFKDLVLDIDYKENIVSINKVFNNLLTFSGEYNIINSLFKINYKINNYDLKRLESLDQNNISGEIKTLSGYLSGELSNFKISFDLDDSYVKYNNGYKTFFSGKAEYFKNNLELIDVKVNKNLINGNINIKEKNVDLNLKFLEENFYKYYNYPNLKYRIIGELNTWGKWEELKGIAKINFDKIYYKGSPLPDLTFELSYNSGSVFNIFSSGRVSLNKLILHNKFGKEISGINGYFNLETKDFKLALSKTNLAIEDLSYVITQERITGNLSLDLNIEGQLNETLSYKTEIRSDGIDYREIHIDDFNLLVLGNDENLELKYFNFLYGKNRLNGFGSINFLEEKYQLKLKGDEIDLAFINIFESKVIDDVNGFLTIDLNINELENTGIIKLNDFSASMNSGEFLVESFFGNVNFNNDVFSIGNLSGKVNKGNVYLNGYWRAPKLSLDLLKDRDIMLKDYELRIQVDDFNYRNDYMNLIIDTELDLSTTLIQGDLVVQSGEVYRLPSVETTTTEFGAKRDLLLEKLNLDVNLTISDEVVVRIEELSEDFAFVRDLELDIEGNGTVTIQNGNINFIGTIDSDNGSLTLNNTLLTISSASAVFEEREEYFPDMNPYISINSETEVSDEEIYVLIDGYYKTLQLRLSSESGLSEQDISSLLLFQKTFDDTETSEVVREILDTQLSSTIFSPFSNEMERIFNISSVNISSKLLSESDGESYTVTNDLILGAELELSDPIYKDKVFWNIKSEFSETESGKVDEYDLWISYKINKNASWKTGLKKDTELVSEGSYFHVDLDFKYRVNSFFSIMEILTK